MVLHTKRLLQMPVTMLQRSGIRNNRPEWFWSIVRPVAYYKLRTFPSSRLSRLSALLLTRFISQRGVLLCFVIFNHISLLDISILNNRVQTIGKQQRRNASSPVKYPQRKTRSSNWDARASMACTAARVATKGHKNGTSDRWKSCGSIPWLAD